MPDSRHRVLRAVEDDLGGRPGAHDQLVQGPDQAVPLLLEVVVRPGRLGHVVAVDQQHGPGPGQQPAGPVDRVGHDPTGQRQSGAQCGGVAPVIDEHRHGRHLRQHAVHRAGQGGRGPLQAGGRLSQAADVDGAFAGHQRGRTARQLARGRRPAAAGSRPARAPGPPVPPAPRSAESPGRRASAPSSSTRRSTVVSVSSARRRSLRTEASSSRIGLALVPQADQRLVGLGPLAL